MGQGMEESVPLGEAPAQALLLPSPRLSCLCGSRNRQPWASTAIRRAGSGGRASASESRAGQSPTSACCWLQLSGISIALTSSQGLSRVQEKGTRSTGHIVSVCSVSSQYRLAFIRVRIFIINRSWSDKIPWSKPPIECGGWTMSLNLLFT